MEAQKASGGVEGRVVKANGGVEGRGVQKLIGPACLPCLRTVR